MKFPYIKISEITEDIAPGFYAIDHEAYHAGPGISSTRLKKALQSYAAYNLEIPIDSPALAFGRAFHAAALEPDVFHSQFAVIPEFTGHKNSNVYKDAFNAWSNAHQGKEWLKPEDGETIAAMVASLRRHPEWQNVQADPEIMAITRCKITGCLLKCKSDLFGHRVLDLKSTSGGVGPGEFLNSIINFGYHVSAAFYVDIIQELTGTPISYIGVPVAKTAPYDCEFYQYSPELLDEGRKLYKAALRRIAKWSKQTPEACLVADKKLRHLNASPRMLYNTIDTLNFIGE